MEQANGSISLAFNTKPVSSVISLLTVSISSSPSSTCPPGNWYSWLELASNISLLELTNNTFTLFTTSVIS